jgi:hypothetical protein
MRRFATPRLEFDGTLGGIDDKEEEQELDGASCLQALLSITSINRP